MAKNNEAKIVFKAETTEFNAQIRDANSAMSALRAGMQLNDAQFKNTGNSADYLRQKQQLLQAQMQQSQAKQEALNGKLQVAQKMYGEDSSEAQRLSAQLIRAQTEEEKLKTALNETTRELDEQSSELGENSNKLGEVGKTAEKAKGRFSVVSTMLGNLASGAITSVVNKLKEAAAQVIRLGSEFTASLSNVQALSGATSAEMAKLEAAAKDLGRNTIFSATQVSDAFGYMALAGWDVEDMLSGVDGVLNLAASSNMDLAQASDIVTDYLTAFGLSAQDSGKFVDQMAYAMSNSNTTTEQLGEAYKNVAATAHSMGFSVEDTTAALMTMANAGVKGGEAGTGLSSIMTRLATDTKGCASELAEYGVEVYDSQGNMNSLSSILNGCAEVFGDLTQEEQANLAKSIAGTSQFSKMQTVLQGLSEQAAENGQSFNDYTEALETCDGAAAEMSGTMQDNLSGDMKALGSAAEGLGLRLFDFFEGPLRGAAQGATKVLNAITDAITPQKTELETFIEDVKASNEAVQDTLDSAKSMVENAGANVGELEAYKDVLLDLNGKTELSEFEHYQLKNAVDALKDSVPGLAAAYDETTGSLNLTNDEMIEMFNNAEALAMQSALLEAQTESYKALAEAKINVAKADSAASKAQEELDDLEQRNAQTADYLAGGYGDLYAEMMDADGVLRDANKTRKEANELMSEAQDEADLTSDALRDLAAEYGLSQEELDSMAEAQKGAGDAATEAGEEVDEFGNKMQETSGLSKEETEQLQGEFNNLANSVSDAMQKSVDMFNEFQGGAEITAEQIQSNLSSQIEGIAQWSQNMEELGAAAGEGMSQELYDYLLEMGPQSANLIQTLVDTLHNDTGQFKDICSEWGQAMDLSNNAEALAAMSTSGRAMSGELAGSIQEGKSQVDSAAKDMAKSAAKSADVSKEMQGSNKAIATDMQKGMQGASQAVSQETNKMKTTANTNLNAMVGSFSSRMQSIRNSVSNAMSSASSAAWNGVSSIRSALNQTITGPHVKVPHFSMSGSFNAQTGAVPTVSVSWWAKGAIFRRPTIFQTPSGLQGVGDAPSPEAVLPIDLLRDYITDAIDQTGGGTTINNYITVDGAQDPDAWATDFARTLKQQMRIG